MGDNDLELSVIRGLNYNLPSGMLSFLLLSGMYVIFVVTYHLIWQWCLPVAAARAQMELPPMIRALPSLLMFHQQLNTFLFNSTFD